MQTVFLRMEKAIDVETANSGEVIASSAGNNGTGTPLSGSLESSNVRDLSQELTEMDHHSKRVPG